MGACPSSASRLVVSLSPRPRVPVSPCPRVSLSPCLPGPPLLLCPQQKHRDVDTVADRARDTAEQQIL
jgi:hypothetical protein